MVNCLTVLLKLLLVEQCFLRLNVILSLVKLVFAVCIRTHVCVLACHECVCMHVYVRMCVHACMYVCMP